jgi:DNA-binding CsgD family transcriptional regulator/PAS domain-containing protein
MQKVARRSVAKETVITKRRPRRWRDMRHLESQIGELIDAAALNPEAWSRVGEELQLINPGVRVVIQAHDPSFGRPILAFSAGWSDHYAEKYNRHLAYLNEVAKVWSNSAPLLTPVLLPDFVMPTGAFIKSAFYNEGLKSEGEAECATGIRILNEGKRRATLALQYGLRHKEEMHERLSPLLQLIAPRIRGAILANRNTIRRQISSLGTDLLQNLIDPALVVDRDRRVISANRSAQDLIASSETMRIGIGDVLSFGDRQTDTHFARLVHDSCQRAPGSVGYVEFGFVHRSARFSASILPLASNVHSSGLNMLPLFARGSVVLIVLRREGPSKKTQEFQSRFRLTDAELRIVQALSQDGSLVRLADQLGIAYETARNQLKAAFKKTGTHSQRELVGIFLRE